MILSADTWKKLHGKHRNKLSNGAILEDSNLICQFWGNGNTDSEVRQK